MKRFSFILFFFAISVISLTANNIQVDSILLKLQNTSASPKHTTVEFNLSWQNSWASSTSWDAAWVFVKYRANGGNWNHATLSTSSSHHSITNNNSTSMTINPSADGKGVFIYRSSTGTGNINLSGVRLRWNYGTDAVRDTDKIAIRVFATEMVYVPTGSFTVGDGNGSTAGSDYSFRASSSNNNPVAITSDSAFSYYEPSGNTTISANFPKGYNAFYVMKYEISQKQYIDFLNTLTITQRNARWLRSGNPGTVDSNRRNYMTWDLSNKDVYLLRDLGGDRACNYMNWRDAMAFADWAALRPMTEFEFEKAARGNLTPVRYEYAWGSTTANVPGLGSMQYDGSDSERCITAAVNTNINNVSIGSISTGSSGPLRVGSLANDTSNRVKAGAGFYGNMELTGNLFEQVIRCGNPNSSSNGYLSGYTGNHGDGIITTAGEANVTNWPTNGYQTCLRGGAYSSSLTTTATKYVSVSARHSSYDANLNRNIGSFGCTSSSGIGFADTRMECVGFRAVRNAQ
jgi:formylglycine-generating enzyme required for sulfatase activity